MFGAGGDDDRLAEDEAEERPAVARKSESTATALTRKKKSRFDDDANDSGSQGNGHAPVVVAVKEPPLPSQLSKEEQLEQMGLNLRRILTAVLLEVTGTEIEDICEEVMKKEQGRNGKPQLKSMLSGYGSESNSDSNDDDQSSDEEIKKTLKKKRNRFQKLEDTI